jgi:iron complex transport system ATP-binding protein
MKIYQTQNLTAGYRVLTVLHDINITIGENDFIGIIGPNGAGKSTLLKILSNNISPTGGNVLFRGRELKSYKTKSLAKKISVVHQSLENVLPFTVYNFLRMGRFPHQGMWEIETSEDREIIEHAMGMTKITHLRERKLSELSGGELQLARIAQSLTQSSDVILLDEPISHLDISHSIQIMDILYKLNREGTTIITVLHDINIASDYCSRIIGIKEGRIFIDGTPDEVLTYENLEGLYDTVCVVYENPLTKKPQVFPVPEYVKE